MRQEGGMVDNLLECEYSGRMHQLAFGDVLPRWTVSDLTRHLRGLIDSDTNLQDLWVIGEVSNLSRPSSGHVYFTLKDSGAALRCVIWRSDAARVKSALEDGMSIEAHGKISIYEAGGQYQLYINTFQPAGEGALYQEFLRLKALLEAEGLFDPSRKRPIPDIPRRIGLVTSPSGAALRDMINTLRRRLPMVEVVLAPAPVQGEEAPPAIAAAIQSLNQVVKPDVIILARGGGSIEDLWAFNTEQVVRAVFHSEAPVITGVGHETDFTLVDFVADLRAPTPTAAAELSTSITTADLRKLLLEISGSTSLSLQNTLERNRLLLKDVLHQVILFSPERRIQNERQRLDEQNRMLAAVQLHGMQLAKARLYGLDSRLIALNPAAVLQRGYAILTQAENGEVISRMEQVNVGDGLKVRIMDGEFKGRVTEKPEV